MIKSARITARPSSARKPGWPSVGDWKGTTSSASATGYAPAATAPSFAVVSGHPLADAATAGELARREQEINDGFRAIHDTLVSLAPAQFEQGFADRAVSAFAPMGIKFCEDEFKADWARPLDMGLIYARAALRLFARMVETSSDRSRFAGTAEEPIEELIENWGYHAVDVTLCADGREAGLLGHVLRIPLSVVTQRRSYAGSMFPVSRALRDWEKVELRRFRDAVPNAADAGTKYLKVGVYHFSSVSPSCQGCAAHGSNDTSAFEELKQRLEEFRGAVEASYGAGDQVELLMVGHDTDTDSIRVHVPDTTGAVSKNSFVCGYDMHRATEGMQHEEAKEAVREAIADAMGVAANDAVTEGLRWFCGYLIKNNIAQVEAVKARFPAGYAEVGHNERMIVVGDPIDDVQLRNLAFQAQMDSIEEGGGDLDIGVKILGKLLPPQGLAVPILAVCQFNPDIPGDEAAAAKDALRMKQAVIDRFASRTDTPALTIEAAIRPAAGGAMTFLDASTCECAVAGRTVGGTGA